MRNEERCRSLASSVARAGRSQCSLGSLLASLRRCALLAEPLRAALLHCRQRPAVSGELACDGDDDDRARLASSFERVPTSVQPPAAALGLGLHRERLAVASAFERDAPSRRAALVPGGLDQQPADVTVAGLGDRALSAPLAAGVLTRGETEKRPQRLGTKPVPVAKLDRQRER